MIEPAPGQTDGCDDPAARVDALVAAIVPRVRPPAVVRRDAVLVAGPWLAGVSGVAAALRRRLPDRSFVETPDLAAGEVPTAVVFVVSAAAALAESDCALLDAAAADTDVVVGAVSKIDVYRQWRQLVQDARSTLAARAPRYRDVPWVGVAGAPEQGEPRVGELAAEIAHQLADPDVQRRNRLRAWESRLRAAVNRYNRDAENADRRARVALLRQQRDTAVRAQRVSKSERTIALRSQVAQARVQLSYFARNRCSSVRGELGEDVAGMTRRRLPGFEEYVRSRVDEVVADVDQGAAAHLSDMAHELGLASGPIAPAGPAASTGPIAPGTLPEVEVPSPPLKSRRLETQLMLLLGVGFGLGVALTLSRLLVGLGPGLTAAGMAACAIAGLAVTVWVVRLRGLLHDRALLDRWVADVMAATRSAVEELVALRVLAAESALSAVLAEQNETEIVRTADRVGALDSELREHAVAAARAATLRDRELPALRRALDVVRAQLHEPVPDGDPAAT